MKERVKVTLSDSDSEMIQKLIKILSRPNYVPQENQTQQ